MSVIQMLQNGKTKRCSDKFGGANKGCYCEGFRRHKRQQNVCQHEMTGELLEFSESVVCVKASGDWQSIEKERIAVEKVVADLDLLPGEYTAEIDASGDVHIWLGANISICNINLVVRDGKIIAAHSYDHSVNDFETMGSLFSYGESDYSEEDRMRRYAY